MVCVGSRLKDDGMNGTAHRYRVVEIFRSIDGEGRRAGMTAQFVRLAGCNLRCSYCDTAYALYGEKEECVYTEMTADEIIRCLDNQPRRITLTGGEPLLQKDIAELITELCNRNHIVNIETNGSINPYKAVPDSKLMNSVFFTTDYKCLSSGSNYAMKLENFADLRETDVVKFVVGSREDMKDAEKFMRELCKKVKHNGGLPWIYFSPVFGEIEAKDIVEFMKEKNLFFKVRVQLQLHKYIYPPEMRGV